MERYSDSFEKNIESILAPQLKRVLQSRNDPLVFVLLFKAGHPVSEELREWLDSVGIELELSDWAQHGYIDHAKVNFHDHPDLAALFKLRYT